MTLWKKTASELAQLFATGEASATEIVNAHLARIDEINPSLNAIVGRLDEQALSAASAADKARSSGELPGPLAGVPFTVKSNIDLAGGATDYGIPALKDAVASIDAPVVERMKNAGGIPLARTNLPDLGLRLHTDSFLHGPTINPWNADHTPGGSSGGEAVALATGMSPIGLGNDLGGSLRNPATCCSIASIKPTFGRVPRCSEFDSPPNSLMLQMFAVNGPMARTIADVKLGLEILSGIHPSDPLSMPIPLNNRPGKKRVAVMAAPPGAETNPAVVAVVMDAAKALEAAGVVVEEVNVPAYEETVQCWIDIVVGTIADGLKGMIPIISPSTACFLQNAVQAFGPFTAERWQQAWVNRFRLMSTWNSFFTKWDAVLTPTWTQLPWLAGFDGSQSADASRFVLETGRPAYPANVLGLPSAAVPAGIVNGLPVGVLLNGAPWSDLTCLELAQHIDDAKLSPPPRF